MSNHTLSSEFTLRVVKAKQPPKVTQLRPTQPTKPPVTDEFIEQLLDELHELDKWENNL